MSVEQRVVFTVTQFERASRLTRDEAREFLADFAEMGLVERVPGRWRPTPEGLRRSLDVARGWWA